MRKILYILVIMFCQQIKAQPGKEAWHWRFGYKCGLDFSSGTPIPSSAAQFFPAQPSASISDANTGQYLFSIGYHSVYDKNNNIMSNGAAMKPFGSQGALIIPKPGSSNIYYIITNDPVAAYNHGVLYSVVDMNLQGGLGGITIKNKVLCPPPTISRLAGVRHCNGTDYWILTHSYNSNTFNAYLVTSLGIDTVPVVSNAGVFYNAPLNAVWGRETVNDGSLKASPNGKKLASTVGSDSLPIVEIFDFDNATGVVSNPITINYPGLWGPWGLSFSPDNSKLYTDPHSDSTGWIYQYDMSSNIPAIIIASKTVVGQTTSYTGYPEFGGEITGMQMAPDGKIYVARCHNNYLTDTLAVINNPNNLGLSCNFQYNGLFLTPGTASQFCLPNFIDANYAGIQINIPDIQQCNTFTATTLDAGAGYANYFWSTGASTQTITVNNPGKYWVTVSNAQGCTKTDTINAYLLNPLKSSVVACDTFRANVTQGGVLAYNWFDANHNPIRNFTVSGNYYVDINYVSGCAIRDSIDLVIYPSPAINLGKDTAFCKGDLVLDAKNPSSTYTWSTGATSSAITATLPGVYWVEVTDANGCRGKDTLVITPQFSAFNFVMPNIVTPNNDNINDVIDFGAYQYSSLQIEIYNRWGQKVFESSDPKSIWRPSGDEGTYFYTMQYKIECGTEIKTSNNKGFITVVR